MFHCALFQFGMDAALLNAAQREGIFAARALEVRLGAMLSGLRTSLSRASAAVVANPLRVERKSRGNSAKALIARVGTTGSPARS